MSGHTPGPWRYFRGTHSVWSVEKAICIMAGPKTRECEERDANARLIEAAPDLLEACNAAQWFIRNGIELGFIRMPDADCQDPAHMTPGLIDAAIAKATGTQPAGEGEK